MARRLEHIQDELIVLRAQDGDGDAVGELIARWRRRLAAHAWSLTRDPGAVEDVTQEAWLAIVRGLGRLDDPARFGAWAHRIVGNKSADWIRRVRRQRAVRVPPTDAPTEPVDGDPRMRIALAGLAPDARTILSLHHVGELNVNQIAVALDIPVGTVKSRLFNARRDLKAAYERTSP